MNFSSPKSHALHVAETLRQAGHIAYFAGGCVRDQLLGYEPQDFDVATSATPDQILALFPKSDAIGQHFGVIIAKGAKGIATEIATFRTDGSYSDHRRPDTVTFSTPEHDAQRRDFTINGLFQDPKTGTIIDHIEGQKDLRQKTLRAIGEPNTRFQEDALRLLRAIRFALHTGFQIEAKTWAAICQNAHRLATISPERIRDEFSKIIAHPDRARGLDLLLESTLADHFIPELRPLIGCEQPPEWHPEGDVYTHTRIALSLLEKEHNYKPTLELCLAVLLHDIAKPPTQTWDTKQKRYRFNGHDALGAEMTQTILQRLRYSNQIIDEVTEMVAYHMRFMHVQDMRTAKLKRFMARPTFPLELHLHRVDCDSSNGFRDNYDFLLKKQEDFANEPLIPEPLINGNDLIACGFTPGKRIGEILRTIQTEQLEKRLATREDALQYLHQNYLTE